MDGIEIQKLLPWPHDGTDKDGDARFSIIVLMTVYMTFSPATHRIENERRHVIPGSRTTDLFLEMNGRLQTRSQFFDTANHVVNEHIVRLDPYKTQATNQTAHHLHIIVHATLKYGLVAHGHTGLDQSIQGLLRDLCHLVGMIEVRVEGNEFMSLPPVLNDTGHGPQPGVVGEQFLRHHGRSLGGEPETPDMIDAQQRLSEVTDLIRSQIVHVTTTHDDVLQFVMSTDVLKNALPTVAAGTEVNFLHILGVETHRVGASTEATVDGTRIEGQEQSPVVIAVGQALNR